MKTPEEIKKGLWHCGEDGCADCPYDDDCGLADHFTQIARDSLAYIQQLETELAQTKRERDAAVCDLALGCKCDVCIHKSKSANEKPCNDCASLATNIDAFEWRGVCEENTKEE